MSAGLRIVTVVGVFTGLLGGCMTYEAARLTTASPPPDLTVIKVGATRETIEQVLGKPVKCENSVCTYEYNTSDPGVFVRVIGVPLSATMDFFTGGLFSVAYWSDFRKAREAQRAEVSIVYGPRDTVTGLSAKDAEAQYHQWLHSEDRKESLRLLCLAANAGFAPAQSAEAMRHRYGLWASDVDRVRAYLWLRLAAFGGHPSASETMSEWAATLTPGDIAEADRLFRDWEPESC